MEKTPGCLVIMRSRPDQLSDVALRNLQNIRALAKLGPVDVLTLANGPLPTAASVEGVRDWHGISLERHTSSFANHLRMRRWWWVHPVPDRYESDAAVAWLRARLGGQSYRCVVIEELALARYARTCRKMGVHVVFDAHNVESALRGAPGWVRATASPGLRSRVKEKLLALRLRREEARAIGEADLVWACSERDVSTIGDLYGKKAWVVPNGVDTELYDPGTPAADATDWTQRRMTLLFTGSFSYYPNQEAALRLIQEVMPLVRSKHPEARLLLVGSEPSAAMREAADGNRIVVTGAVPSIMPYLHSACVAVIPLMLGSGTRLKILEAFAARVPVVCNAKAAEGIAAEDGVHLLLRDDAEAMAAAACELWENQELRERTVSNAADLVRQHHSLRVAADKIAASLPLPGGRKAANGGNAGHDNEKTDVWFIPFDRNNPYQRDLAGQLGELGIKVGERTGIRGAITESLLKSNKAIIHLHWLPRFSPGWRGWVRASIYVSQLQLLRLLGRQIVWTIHNLYHHEAVSRFTDRWVQSQVTRIASQMVVHSPSARESVVREFAATNPLKISVIPHGNYLQAYENRASRSEARAALDLPRTALVFLSLGWLRPYKGLEGLIRVFRESPGDHKRLVIAGKAVDPAFAERLRREAGADQRIILKPERVPDEEIQIFMNAADAVVLPYREILTSGAVVLAMSFGRACVAPKIGCIPDLLDNEGAILYDPDHERGLADALEAVETKRQSLPQMGEHNLAIARTWGWDRVAVDTARLYQLQTSDRQAWQESADGAAEEQESWVGEVTHGSQQLRRSSRD